MPIIINSKSCSNAGFWAKHLQKAETNERVEIVGFYGLSAETIEDALSEMHAMAAGSKKCSNYFSQYNINPRADEHLTEAQWEAAHALHRKNHGLDHLPYFRVRHIKDGRLHEHGIALRVDPETGKAISDSLTAAINERTSRTLEIKFDLERGQSILIPDREFDRPDRRPKKTEAFRGTETGINPEAVKADAQAAKQRADNGQSFKTALEASGAYVLARGDRRDFVIIDRAGDDHSLARRLAMKAAEMRAFMADLDPASLPSVTEAKTIQAARQAVQQQQAKHGARLTNSAPASDFANGSSSKRKKKMAIEREDATDPKVQKQQIDDQQALAARIEKQIELSEQFLASVKRAQEEDEKLKEAEAAARRAAPGDDITDARGRYLQAAGERYDIRRPYSSLSEVVGLEFAMFQREQEKLKQEAAQERDPDKRELIDLRRQIEANDYMAITSHRLSEMSKVNSQSAEAQREKERAEYFAAEALELRRQRRELHDRINQHDNPQERAENPADAAKAARGQGHAAPDFGPVNGIGFPIDNVALDNAVAEQNNTPPEAPRGAAQTHEAAAASQQPGQPAKPASEPQLPAEIIQFGPERPVIHLPDQSQPSTRETTDTRQAESASAENTEITDSKAAKKAALAQMRAETEQSIQQGQERGYGNSR